ncbi:MAG: epoxyqueuosine reductase, partial [Paracoccaceae bacterium]|nr:epoxyqueuosine reductase [Paracoccaceae bacterium]
SFFSKSPIKRIGRDRFIRNVIYAIGNSNDPSLIPYLESYLIDTNYVLMDAAKWAVERLNKL